jgi:hypothetical protein
MPNRPSTPPKHLLPSSQLQRRRPPKCLGTCLAAATITAITAALPDKAVAQTGTILRGKTHLPECREALRIAKAVFRSNAPYLYAPPEVPVDGASELVLGPSDLDISGGDALVADPEVFDKEPKLGDFSHRSVYWQKSSQAGYRLAIDETPHGWRGDRYAVFAVSESTKLDDFITQVSSDLPRRGVVRPLAEDSWRPPLVFRSRSGPLWFIDVGPPSEFLGAWSVYVGNARIPKVSCSIDFRPRSIRRAVELLPPPVRTLAALLDKTIGSGEGEGPMQQTAHLRLEVQHGWANAALRPWALESLPPYNARAEVDASLVDWARKASYNEDLLARIRRQYRLAEPSMATYYRVRFGLSKTESKRLAARALDIMFRANYVFNKERPDVPRT